MTPPQPVALKPGNGSATASPAFVVRPALPDRQVTTDTIEDAYVRFIFYCNPALPLSTDTEALREAFRNPPRSGGKVFNTFTVYELVKKFYDKEIKTWTELTTTLGVEPPDPSKDESAQKVAQYGVRLKKWMNSMHVKSFFEYLMNIANDYWMQIPSSPIPTAQPVRDGVAVEDDMALRALLPHIRPKRGRKRPEGDDNTNSPAQRQRLSPSSAIDPGSAVPWSAHPDAQAPFLSASWGMTDAVQTPLTKWPHSAITPTTRGTFWDDPPEPRSAITPSKPKLNSQRRGAKNVSSAWKPGGPDSSAKTRGRPPINRPPVEIPTWTHPSWNTTGVQNTTPAASITPTTAQPSSESTRLDRAPPHPPVLGRTASEPMVGAGRQNLQDGRPARPSISLQVPKRQGGAVRLATPPPLVMVNGKHSNGEAAAPETEYSWHDAARDAADASGAASTFTGDGSGPVDCQLDKMVDRTNVDALTGYFVQETFNGEWVDAEGKPAERASLEECTAIVNMTIQDLARRATSVQVFLRNLAALAGAKTMMTQRCRCARLGEDADKYQYSFNWKYQFGTFKGVFNLAQDVPRSVWTRPEPEPAEEDAGGGEQLSAAEWQRKYQALRGEMAQRDRELVELRGRVMASLREDAAS